MNTIWFVSLPRFLLASFHVLSSSAQFHFVCSCFADSEISFDTLIDVIGEGEGDNEKEKDDISTFLLKLEQLGIYFIVLLLFHNVALI